MKKILSILVLLATLGATASAEDYSTWTRTYHTTKDLSQFDGFWKMVSERAMLGRKNQMWPVIGFSNRVFHEHPELLAGRLDDPMALPEDEREGALTILWLSQVKPAEVILRHIGRSDLLDKPVPPIGDWQIARGQDLDFCWGWYFATGSTEALKPIVRALDLNKYQGALKRYRSSAQTEEDRNAAMKDAIYGAANWSLMANGREDGSVARFLYRQLKDPATPETRKFPLSMVLAGIGNFQAEGPKPGAAARPAPPSGGKGL